MWEKFFIQQHKPCLTHHVIDEKQMWLLMYFYTPSAQSSQTYFTLQTKAARRTRRSKRLHIALPFSCPSSSSSSCPFSSFSCRRRCQRRMMTRRSYLRKRSWRKRSWRKRSWSPVKGQKVVKVSNFDRLWSRRGGTDRPESIRSIATSSYQRGNVFFIKIVPSSSSSSSSASSSSSSSSSSFHPHCRRMNCQMRMRMNPVTAEVQQTLYMNNTSMIFSDIKDQRVIQIWMFHLFPLHVWLNETCWSNKTVIVVLCIIGATYLLLLLLLVLLLLFFLVTLIIRRVESLKNEEEKNNSPITTCLTSSLFKRELAWVVSHLQILVKLLFRLAVGTWEHLVHNNVKNLSDWWK